MVQFNPDSSIFIELTQSWLNHILKWDSKSYSFISKNLLSISFPINLYIVMLKNIFEENLIYLLQYSFVYKEFASGKYFDYLLRWKMTDKINGWGNLYRELLSCKFSTWNEIIQIYDFNSGCFYNKCVTILNERKCDLFYVFSVFMVRPSYCHKRRHYFLLSPCPASAQHHDRTCNNFELLEMLEMVETLCLMELEIASPRLHTRETLWSLRHSCSLPFISSHFTTTSS